MVHKLIFLLLLLHSHSIVTYSQNNDRGEIKKIVIEVSVNSNDKINRPSFLNSDSVELIASPYNYLGVFPEWSIYKQKNKNDNIRWELKTDKPLLVRSSVLGRNGRIVNPGDSIFITYINGKRNYTGKGVESWILQEEIEQIQLFTFKKPTKSQVHIKSQDDYFKWKEYLDQQLKVLIPLINSYSEKLSASLFTLIKTSVIRQIVFQRGESFNSLYFVAKNTSTPTLTDLTAIFDTTINDEWGKWLKSKTDSPGDIWQIYKFNKMEIWRRFNFDLTKDSANEKTTRQYLYYNSIKQNYTGLLKERLLQLFLAEETIKEMGYNHPLSKFYLKDYYQQAGFPEYKQWMRNFEKKANRLYNFELSSENNLAPDFTLTDSKGKNFSKSNLKGKIALLDFWFSGCTGCVDLVPQLQNVEEALKNDPNVVFVNICVDKDISIWLKSIKNKKYTTGEGINLFTNGMGSNHPILKDYNITSYPELFLLNANGEIVKCPLIDPRKDNGTGLINLIKKESSKLNDGPYVLYKGDTISISYIKPLNGELSITTEKMKINKEVLPSLKVSTDMYPSTFPVKLKSKLEVEPAIFTGVSKQLVLSDIEGNFDAFRKLLQANGVIDADYNWTFEKGHLVFVGDMFDRGEQVTECLWLIYSLEEKAKRGGGYVHFILGNHEILNLSNDQRYVQNKYKQNVILLNENYTTLYGENSELGRWLRTKNIIEKIGDVLYTHAGISKEVNALPLSLQQINNLIRPHYAKRDEFKKNKKEPALKVLFNSGVSPFWYRGYYKQEDQTPIIDSTLKKFGVNRIVTGHTIVADTISLHYDGKVINVDTQHAQGKSEALLIDSNQYYRVNIDGKKTLLIKSEDRFYLTSTVSESF